MVEFGVVVLAGGAGRRLGGAAKPTLPVGGRPMVARVLAAVADAADRVVVGPASLGPLVPAGVRVVQEEPAGGGPVAALAAGLASRPAPGLAERPAPQSASQPAPGVASRPAWGLASGNPGTVVVLAADLPLLTREAVGQLLAALGHHDGAVFVDGTGRQQWLCGAWSVDALARRIAGFGPLAGRSLREFVAPLDVVEVAVADDGRPPWYDCDTPAALAEAETRLEGPA